MRARNVIFGLFLLWLLAACQSPKAVKVVTLSSPEAIEESEADLVGEASARLGSIGYVLIDAETGKVLASRNEDQPYIPASVNKIATALAALEILGPGFQFKTLLAASSSPARGKVRQLYLKGSGDPLLSVPDLQTLVESLRKRRVREVTEQFVFDDGELLRQPQINEQQEAEAPYNPAIGALSSEFNRAEVLWEFNPAEAIVEAFTLPALPQFSLSLNVAKKEKSNRLRFQYIENQEQWAIPVNPTKYGKKDIPVKDGGKFTAELFAKLARNAGIKVPKPQRGHLPASHWTVRIHESAPLIETVGKLLEFSNNLIAEELLLVSSRKLSGHPARSLSESAAAVKTWLLTKIRQVNFKGFEFVNGSGLTVNGRLTPQQAAGMLKWAESREYRGKSFLSLLPISGWKGSLRGRLEMPETALRVWAKTGTMNYASGLAGYLFTQSNRRMLFAVFINDASKRAQLDQEMAQSRVLSDRSENEAERWVEAVRDVQDRLVTHWITSF